MAAFEFGTRVVHSGRIPGNWKERVQVPSVDLRTEDEVAIKKSVAEEKLQECIASTEAAKYALVFPSGSSAMATVVQLLELGDHAIVFDSVYHGTRTCTKICQELGRVDVSFLDLRDYNLLTKHIRNNTKMVIIETPSNPVMKIIDIAAIAKIVRKDTDAVLVVDNTFMTPYFQNPLLLGANIVTHSMTKYMNGYSDVLMGAIATNNDTLFGKLQVIQESTGVSCSPMDCYLVLRGLKTLHLRMERHMENAIKVAQFLEAHPRVEKVFYPGLKSHPQHDLALKQCSGFGGMVAFLVKGGSKAEACAFIQRLKVFTLAGSLGSVESLCNISSFMTAKALTPDQRQELGIAENLVRLSVGLESAEDLLHDLEQALAIK